MTEAALSWHKRLLFRLVLLSLPFVALEIALRLFLAWRVDTGLLLYGHRHKTVRRRPRGISRAAGSVSRFFRELF